MGMPAERTLRTATRMGAGAACPTAARSATPSRPQTMKAAMGGAGEPKRPMRKAACTGPSSGMSLTTTAARAPASAQSQTEAAQSGVAGERWIDERKSNTMLPSLPVCHSGVPMSM